MYALSPHALQRISQRFFHLTTPEKVLERVNKFSPKEHRAYIEVSRFPYTEVNDPSVVPDGVARGDRLVVILEDGIVESVMLRKSWENSAEYHKVYRKPKGG